jgi:hypothetical protein
MKNIKRHEALLGVGLLSAVTVFGVAQPTLAKPDKEVKAARKDVKEARKELKQEKKDVAKADTRRERRQEYQDVKAARQNVQTQRQELKQERWENKSNRNNTNRRYDYSRRNGYVPRNGYAPRSDYTRRDFRTLDGVVTNDLRGRRFSLRTSAGRTTVVQLQGGEPNRLSRGDRIRVSGYFANGYFAATSLNILRNR